MRYFGWKMRCCTFKLKLKLKQKQYDHEENDQFSDRMPFVRTQYTHTLSALQLERKVKRTDFVCTFFVINLQLEIRPAENEK